MNQISNVLQNVLDAETYVRYNDRAGLTMKKCFERTGLMLGKEGMERLAASRVAVFGIGGVGGYVVEALVRSGLGAIDLVDGDFVDITNLNRQIIATRDTVGMLKVDAAEGRIKRINPDCRVTKWPVFFSDENCGEFDFSLYDYIVDAIDDVPGKILIIKMAEDAGTDIISSMGAGNKMDPSAFEVSDIYKTSVCPLAKRIRKACRDNGIKELKVVYSRELPLEPDLSGYDEADIPMKGRGRAPGSNAFVPPAAGLLIASVVIKDLSGFIAR